jgi:hypothetical protein
MSKSFGDGWTAKEANTDSLVLDPRNPRLSLQPDATQEQVRKALLADEEVFELAQKIAKAGTMLAGVVKE